MKKTICALILFLSASGPSVFGRTDAVIPSAGNNSVVKVTSSADPEVITSVSLSDAPYGGAVLPDGSYVLVSRRDSEDPGNTDHGLVTAIPLDDFTDTGAQIDISVGDQPRGVAVESDGNYAFVANYGDDTVTKIYTPTWSVADTIDLRAEGFCSASDPCGPWAVTAVYDEEDGTPKAYVTNHENNSIAVISNSGVELIENTSDLPLDGPLGIAVTPDGRYLYVANFDADSVAIIDTESLVLSRVLSVGDAPWGVAVGADGAYVYVTNSGSNTVSVIDTESQVVTATYATGDQPFGVAAPKNGNYAYIVNHGDNTITKITHTSPIVDPEEISTGSAALNNPFGLGAFFGGEPPAAPSGLNASVQEDATSEIALSWTDNSSNEVGFKIERRKDGENIFTQIAKVAEDVTTYTATGLERETLYEFRVRAYSDAADSNYSSEAGATTGGEKFSWCFIGGLLIQ
jgi:YVTN family beta-propeller protein